MVVLPFIVLVTIHAFWKGADDSIGFQLLYYLSCLGVVQSFTL